MERKVFNKLVRDKIPELLDKNGGETETDVMRQMSVSAVVDLTSMLALADMSRAAIMVRRLRKELGS